MTCNKKFPEPIPKTDFSFNFLLRECKALFDDFIRTVYKNDIILSKYKNNSDFAVINDQLRLGAGENSRYVSEHLFEQYLIEKYRIFISINVCGNVKTVSEEYPSSISTYLWYNEKNIETNYADVAKKINDINNAQLYDSERKLYSVSKRLALGYAARIANLMLKHDIKESFESIETNKKSSKTTMGETPQRMLAPISEIAKSNVKSVTVNGKEVSLEDEKKFKEEEDKYAESLSKNILEMNMAQTSEEWENFVGHSPF